jgi:dsDNA-specific endonuclease/ATPase MutS2
MNEAQSQALSQATQDIRDLYKQQMLLSKEIRGSDIYLLAQKLQCQQKVIDLQQKAILELRKEIDKIYTYCGVKQ